MLHKSIINAPHTSGLSCAGTWRLEPCSAITLTPTIDAKICPQLGGLWVTLGDMTTAVTTDPREQDIFLRQGETLIIAKGTSAVIEPWGRQVSEPCYFSWNAVMPELALPIQNASTWSLQIEGPWQDLKAAMVQAAGAALRLTCGVLTLPWHGRGLAKCVDGAAQI